MRVLVGKTFGLGNCVMCIPMLKALRSTMGPEGQLDVLIGSTPDDGEAFTVFKYLKDSGIIDNIIIHRMVRSLDQDIKSITYDFAVMSIPFDGRWQNGIDYKAHVVLDGRTRPDPSTTGLVSWKKHEVEYQLDNAYDLGFDPEQDEDPDMSFYPKYEGERSGIYLGVGYKKDTNNFWSKKHWGNDNFRKFIFEMMENDGHDIKMTGDLLDWKLSISPITSKFAGDKRLYHGVTSLNSSFEILNSCKLYVGNDTGMMHVAASMGIPCVSTFFLQNSYTKNRPWGIKHFVADGNLIEDTLPSVLEHARKFLND